MSGRFDEGCPFRLELHKLVLCVVKRDLVGSGSITEQHVVALGFCTRSAGKVVFLVCELLHLWSVALSSCF